MNELTAGKTLLVVAPLSGWCASLDDSPDAVFRDRILGDGASIDPTDNVVLAPVDGEVVAVPPSKHAINLRADNGAEFLIHVGIDTVRLAGDGFTAHVAAGDRVTRGQRLLSFDLDRVMRGVASLRTPVLLLQNDAYKMGALDRLGPIKAGDALFEVTVAAAVSSPAEPTAQASINRCSRTVFVGLEHGIHARPAAMLVDSIKRYDARITCETRSGKTADARSAVALMAMGITHGARLTVSATGVDAEPALAEFVAGLAPLDEPPQGKAPPAGGGRRGSVKAAARPAGGAVLRAQSAGSGLAIGACLQIRAWEASADDSSRTPDEERGALEEAVTRVREYLEKLSASQGEAGSEIALAHIALLEDPTIADAAYRRIRDGASAAAAWRKSVAEVAESLKTLDKRLRERVDDLLDVNQRVQRALAGHAPGDSVELPRDAVIIAHTLLPSQLLEFDRTRVAAICTAAGGTTSHVAILAASMDIPMLVAAGDAVLGVENGSLLAVDADYGELYIEPDEKQTAAVRARMRDDEQRKRRAQAAANQKCLTADGVKIEVNANIASVSDAREAVRRGADGCGLLRTEFVFIDRAEPPDSREQLRVYQQISDAFDDRPLVVRTLDAGGDKPIAYVDQAVEENPALGVRGIRLSLRNKAMFDEQLDALLRLHRNGALKIMIPMVTSVDEVCAVRDAIDVLRQTSGTDNKLQLGVMIETPAAALIAGKLAALVDFFSIGTNDLTQYTLAMDRGESSLAAQLDALHPAVLRLIHETAIAAREEGKPVAVCGGAAGDVLAAPILIGLGIRELSMVPGLIARQKARLRELNVRDCESLARQSLAMDSAREVRAMMREFASELAGD